MQGSCFEEICEGCLEVDPGFIRYHANEPFESQDFHLDPSSPLRDAGDPELLDSDESRSDIGAYGGPAGAMDYYLDEDQDGLFDGWETLNGLDPTTDDSSQDPDKDGATNAAELEAGTDPQNADSDGDGAPDGSEIDAGSDPNNWFSMPEGTAAARVPEDFPTIQSAIDVITDSGEIEISAGIYEESLDVVGKRVTLRSVDGRDATIIRGQERGTLFARDAELNLQGLTLSGGVAEEGGGVAMVASSGSFDDLLITENEGFYGGGLWLQDSTLSISGSSISENEAIYGGGIYLDESSLELNDSEMVANTAWDGAGIYGRGASILGNGLLVQDNVASCDGGAVLAEDSELTIDNALFTGNQAGENGGALNITDCTLELGGTELSANIADSGAGVFGTSSSLTLANTLLVENYASTTGGAIRLSGSIALDQCTLAGNRALDAGGGLLLETSIDATPDLTINASILAFNIPGNVHVSGQPSGKAALLPEAIQYSDFYSEIGPNHNLEAVDESNLEVDPGFVFVSRGGDGSSIDTHLAPGSPMRNAGPPGRTDPDGSLADLGAFGGPNGDQSYYTDADADGQYDGWEASHGLDTDRDDSSEDADADGLGNLEELEASADPTAADTDGDGSTDGAEVAAGSDPLSWSSRPEGDLTLHVPEDYASIQEAIDAVPWSGAIEIAEGIFHESLEVSLKKITIASAGTEGTRLGGEGGSVLTARGATLVIQGLTFTGGEAVEGGGTDFSGVNATLINVEVSRNTASEAGGGVAATHSDITLSNCKIESNDSAVGGGMWLVESSVTLAQSTLSDNTVEGEAPYGGGVYMDYSNAAFTHCRLERNESQGDGAAIWGYASNLSLENVLINRNITGSSGSIFLNDSKMLMSNCAATGNDGIVAGGVALGQESVETSYLLENSILSHNSLYQLYRWTTDWPTVEVSYSDLYAEGTDYTHNLYPLEESNLEVEPGFLTYDTDGRATDFHLSTSSILIDRGDEAVSDTDCSRSDMGIFGGPQGGSWDLDADGLPDYFWPGMLEDAPEGFSAESYDCDDRDEGVGMCIGE